MQLTKIRTKYAVKSKILVSPNIGNYGESDIVFLT